MKPYFEREQLIWGSLLAPTEKLLLLCLNSFVDAKGECFPGKERLSSMCGVDVRTITRIVQRLNDIGVISKTPRRLGSRQQSNLYRVRFSAIPQSVKTLKSEVENEQDNLSLSSTSQQDNLSKSAGQFVQVSRTICPSQQDNLSPDLSIDLSIDLSREKEDPERSFSENAVLSEPEPVAPELPALSSLPKDADAPSSTGNETVSADPRKIFTKENIEAKEWAMHTAPWRLNVAEYRPSMLAAIAKANGKLALTETGQPNEGWLLRHLQKLERHGRENCGQEAIAARVLLLSAWGSAQESDKAHSVAPVPIPFDHVPEREAPPTPEEAAARLEHIKRLANIPSKPINA